jgi:hypothetical protein
MTMEGKARENQRIASETAGPLGRGARDVRVEAGIPVHQKNYAAGREIRGKGREKGQIC